jgi:hypothetical protein
MSMYTSTFVGTKPQMRTEIQKEVIIKRKATIKYPLLGDGVRGGGVRSRRSLRAVARNNLSEIPRSIRSITVPNPTATTQMNIETFLDFQGSC